MASLGSFGAAAREYEPPAEPDTFEFYGETFTVQGKIPAMVELTFTAALAGKVSAAEGDVALFEALRHALTIPEREVDGEKAPADASQWTRFSRLADEKRAISDDLTAIAMRIMGWQVGRPTGQQSGSSPGPLPTSTSSNSSASLTPDSPASTQDAAASAG